MVKISSDPALSDHFTILAFPCNQFGNQEPKTNDLIEKFAKDNYAVNFPMFSKIDIVGDSAHPLFKYLSGVSKKEPTWNFWKFLVDHKGHVINSYGPWISVDSIYPEIIAAVRKARGISHGNEL
ncbi:glutathione peroxidase 7-like [Saccoglossus kowalevskii]|uniref:Glutathione peroxidase n=1 Tax=Saccoglossus kowalevskii TaxID=10224 RepID=A0ABM0MEV7_SACKO|nr:PREDICTED: glutathione peroxidase 7-like [Saccoglossus kowalevskii]